MQVWTKTKGPSSSFHITSNTSITRRWYLFCKKVYYPSGKLCRRVGSKLVINWCVSSSLKITKTHLRWRIQLLQTINDIHAEPYHRSQCVLSCFDYTITATKYKNVICITRRDITTASHKKLQQWNFQNYLSW